MAIAPITSFFLDLLRIGAAATVFASHAYWVLYGHPYDHRLPIPAHDAVIVFFVLSGYVICFSTLGGKRPGPKAYAIARLTRLYSVVVPALMLTLALALIGQTLMPAIYRGDPDFIRYTATLLYLQSSWSLTLSPLSNGPFWSLGYEFWYYVLFGLLVYSRTWLGRILGALFCLVMMGWSIIALSPLWAMGALGYIYRDAGKAPGTILKIGLGLSAIAAITIAVIPEFPGKVPSPPLQFAAAFGKDWLLGLAVTSLIWFFNRAMTGVSVSRKLDQFIRWVSNHTFSLYLFHFPLMAFFFATGVFNQKSIWQNSLETLLILAIVVGLSEVTEGRRKTLQKKLMQLFGDRPTPSASA